MQPDLLDLTSCSSPLTLEIYKRYTQMICWNHKKSMNVSNARKEHYMWATWVTAQPTLKIEANTLYPTVSRVDELVPVSLQGKQLPKTDEKEIATRIDPPACHSLKCPKRSIWNKNDSFMYLLRSNTQQIQRNLEVNA